MVDKYQERYIWHQFKKKKELMKLMRMRHSNRIFSDKPIDAKTFKTLMEASLYVPSSCNRQGVEIIPIDSRDDKAILGGLLVGGVGWIHRAPLIFLLMADPFAYKAGDEVSFMPYLDAGVIVQQIWLMATALNLKCAYVNPNIRKQNQEHFYKLFGAGVFCGALAIGYEA